MAEVYLARDQMLDRAVAVKVLFPALATDPGFVERFRREAQSAAGLNHPNIVGVYDWGEANGTYFIVMEYVEGESLAETIHAEGRLNPDRAAEIASDIAAALGFAHRNGGVIHRDVKPGNVLITREGAVKVADFGIARAISDSSDQNLTKTGSVMGTATYFSPEQARGAGVDPRSDVYSLGCVIYEMVTGRPPFQGENAVAIAYKHVQEAPVSPRLVDPAIPDTLEAITLKCLAKNPANRYPSAQDLRADLTRYLQGARIMAEPVMAQGDPGATGLMSPTGYMQPTVAGTQMQPQSWEGNGYGDQYDQYGDYEEEEEEPKNKAFLAVLVLLILLLGGVLFLAAKALNKDDSAKDLVAVPSVVGKTRAEAIAALDKAGLKNKVVAETSDEPKDKVLRSDPGAGEKIEKGRLVTLTVSGGKELFDVPDVRGKSQEDATKALTDSPGKFLVTPVPQAKDGVDEGTVFDQDPKPGVKILAAGEEVKIFVASGSTKIAVPQVKGMSFEDAKNALTSAGFTGSINQSTESSADVEAGKATRTDPAAGQQLAKDTAITVFISSGSDEVDVPDVTGRRRNTAETILRGRGFNVNVTESDVDDPKEDGKVLDQNPNNGKAPRGSTINLVVGVFRGTETTPPTGPTTSISLPFP
jgi:serine/threonine-protein kinase